MSTSGGSDQYEYNSGGGASQPMAGGDAESSEDGEAASGSVAPRHDWSRRATSRNVTHALEEFFAREQPGGASLELELISPVQGLGNLFRGTVRASDSIAGANAAPFRVRIDLEKLNSTSGVVIVHESADSESAPNEPAFCSLLALALRVASFSGGTSPPPTNEQVVERVSSFMLESFTNEIRFLKQHASVESGHDEAVREASRLVSDLRACGVLGGANPAKDVACALEWAANNVLRVCAFCGRLARRAPPARGIAQTCDKDFCAYRLREMTYLGVDLFTALRSGGPEWSAGAGVRAAQFALSCAESIAAGAGGVARSTAILSPLPNRFLLSKGAHSIEGTGGATGDVLSGDCVSIDSSALHRILGDLISDVSLPELSVLPSNLAIWLYFVKVALLRAGVSEERAQAIVRDHALTNDPLKPPLLRSCDVGENAAGAAFVTVDWAEHIETLWWLVTAFRSNLIPGIPGINTAGAERAVPFALQSDVESSLPPHIRAEFPQLLAASTTKTASIFRIIWSDEVDGQRWGVADAAAVVDAATHAAAAAHQRYGTDMGELHQSSFFWHGSSLGNWLGILRHGVLCVSGSEYMSAGAALGEGAYFARQCQTSMGYSQMHAGYGGALQAPLAGTAGGAAGAAILEKVNIRYRSAIGVAEIRIPTPEERAAAALECKTRLKDIANEGRQVTDYGWAIVCRKSPWMRMRWVIGVF
jgi:hypothetical protein